MNTPIKLEEKYEYNGWPSIARPDVKPPEGWNLSLLTAVNLLGGHELSPDGQTIAFTWMRDDQTDVYTLPAAGGWPRRVSTERKLTWPDEAVKWSPDSQWLAFDMNGHVVVAPATGGLPQKISDFASAAASPIWLPDNYSLVVTVERHDSEQLLLTNRDGQWPRPLVTRTDGDCGEARPSPDGRFISYTFRPFNDLNRLDIHLVELATGHIRELTPWPKVRNWHGRWSPDGSQIAFLSQKSGWNEVWLAQPDGQGLRQLTHLKVDVADIAWSPDGTRLACTLNQLGALHLALLDAQTGAATTLRAEDEGVYTQPQWSPDGHKLLVQFESPLEPPDLRFVDLDGRVTPLTFSMPGALTTADPKASKLLMPERVSYKSYDGLEIPAFLYRPQKPNGAAIVHPHGGPSAQEWLGWDLMVQYFVAKGYTWLQPNYRGSTGYGVAFEQANYNDWGNGDRQDCLYGARFVRELPGIDPARIAIYGASYGGYMVACTLSRDPDYLFACGVDKFGDANTISSWAQCNRDLRLYSEIFLGHPARNRQVYVDASPIHQVENVQNPVLIFHGLEDDIVPPQASEEWTHALRQAGKTFEYKTYAGEGHGFLKWETQLDFYGRMERFLDWYLLP
jgi:dipeptidyl aminopeptidase/acylaminoacyl peptidase